MNVWKQYVDKLADKLMDAGNIVFAALIIGQIVAGKVDWISTVVAGIAWLGLYGFAYFVLYLARKEQACGKF
jgi:hypothetical protein